MAAYLIARIAVLDPPKWAAYRAAVGPLLERSGGRQLVRGDDAQTLEGTSPTRRLVVIRFDDMPALQSFWHSPEYAEVSRLRVGAAELDVWAVPGE